MGNLGKPFEPNTIYHVYNHGNGDDLIFREEENYRFFLKHLKVYIPPIANVYAYCLMPNHFHFLIRIKNEEELADFFMEKYPEKERSAMSFKDIADLEPGPKLDEKSTKSSAGFADLISNQFKNFLISYSKSFNKMYNRKGSLFLDNIKRIPVTDDVYFTNMIRYIHFNPVLHKFANNPFQWKFSSLRTYLSNKRSLLCMEDVLEWFGGLEPFKNFHQSIQEDEFNSIKHLTIE